MTITEIHQAVRDRIAELKPLVEEHEQLAAAHVALSDVLGQPAEDAPVTMTGSGAGNTVTLKPAKKRGRQRKTAKKS